VALPVFTVGQVLTAADVNQFLKNTLVAYRTATKTVTSSTTLADDTVIEVAVTANCIYEMTAMLKYDGDSAGDLKYQWVGPSGCTLSGTVHQLQSGAASTADDQTTGLIISNALTAGAVGTGSTVQLFNQGFVAVSSTAGTFKLQWAQGTSSATGTRVFADSYVCLRQIA